VARRVCDLENLVNEEAIARVGLQRHVKKKKQIDVFSGKSLRDVNGYDKMKNNSPLLLIKISVIP
jgi:hypothetical protein